MADRDRAILLVEDDAEFGSSLEKIVQLRAPAHLVRTARAARAHFAETPPAGAIVDLLLPDGSGLDLIAEVHDSLPALPMLLLTGVCEPRVVNRVFDLEQAYACKPVTADQVLAFVDRAKNARSTIDTAVAAFAARHRLSPRQADVVALAVVGMSRDRLAVRLSVSENTLKGIVRGVLGKAGAPSLEAVARGIREDALSTTERMSQPARGASRRSRSGGS